MEDGTHPSPVSRSSSGMSRRSSNLLHFSHNIGPLICFPLSSIAQIQTTRAFSTSGCVTIWGRFEDSALGLSCTRCSKSSRTFIFHESVACVNFKAPVCGVAKCWTTSTCEIWGWSSMYAKTVIQSWSVRFSQVLVF